MADNNNNNKQVTIETQRAKSGMWFMEDVAPGLKIQSELRSIIAMTQSEYQDIQVIESYFGKTLVTDGKTQSAELDEYAYHESLVHPALIQSALLMNNGQGPKTVFIGGGGELATARECLRHESVERVVMVDLDGEVVEVSKKYLPEWGGEAVTSDPRFELVIGDAYQWLLDTEERFDVMILDISDPIEAGPGIMLYVQEFYQHAVTRLAPGHGVFVTQAGMADAIPSSMFSKGEQDTSCYGPIRNTLATVFNAVVPYSSNIPSFGSDWGFVMAYNNGGGDEESLSSRVDELLKQQFGGNDPLKFYDQVTHARMFNLTKPLRKSLEEDKRIMTKENPIFMY